MYDFLPVTVLQRIQKLFTDFLQVILIETRPIQDAFQECRSWDVLKNHGNVAFVPDNAMETNDVWMMSTNLFQNLGKYKKIKIKFSETVDVKVLSLIFEF